MGSFNRDGEQETAAKETKKAEVRPGSAGADRKPISGKIKTENTNEGSYKRKG